MAGSYERIGEGHLRGYEDEIGFVLLGLAQIVSIFAVWFGSWPSAFAMPPTLAYSFMMFFLGAGAFGFYLSFRMLSV
jgi:hypothetical protein